MSDRVARRVVVVSADRLFADALRYLLETEGWDVVGVAADGVAALSLVGTDGVRALVMLGDPPRIGAAALTRRIRARRPSITLVAVGPDEVPGAHALRESVPVGELLDALEGPPPAAATERETSSRRGALDLLATLTRRERETFVALASGLRPRDIAARTGTSPNTVRTHLQHVYAKLGVHSMLELVRFAAENGLVERDPRDDGARHTHLGPPATST